MAAITACQRHVLSKAVARARAKTSGFLERNDAVTIYVGSSALGQGIETAFAQIAADALGLPFETFRVLHGSTTFVDEGFGTYHSRALVMGGSAVLDGAKNLVEAIRAAGAAQLGCAIDDVVFEESHVVSKNGRSIGLAQIGET